MTDQPHADYEDDLYWQLNAHAANHPSREVSASSPVGAANPLDYSIPVQLHGLYCIPYELSKAIEPLADRASYLQALWLDEYAHTMNADGLLDLPDWLRHAAGAIQASSCAIQQDAALGRFHAVPGVPKWAAAAYQNHGIGKRVTPLQIRAMLALTQFITWFDRLAEVLGAFDRKVVAKDWHCTDPKLFAFAANDGLADKLRPLAGEIPTLLDECNRALELTSESPAWLHPDLEALCQQLDAHRWKSADVSDLPEDDDRLEQVQILMMEWFDDMARHVNQADRDRAWQNSVFPVLIRGVQGVLIAMSPDWRARILSYASVRDIAQAGLSTVEEAAVVLLRQLFVTQVRNINGPEYHNLVNRLRILMRAVKQDMPAWHEHTRIKREAERLARKEEANAEVARRNGRKSGGAVPKVQTDEVLAAERKLLAVGCPPHEVASKLAQRFAVTSATIRNHLKKRK